MSKNLVELMANIINEDYGMTPRTKCLDKLMKAVKEHIGEVARTCHECCGGYRNSTSGHVCSECKGTGVIARTDGGGK